VAEVQLRTLAGVGESTARAIEETLGEGTPSYLKALEATMPLPLSDTAAALRGRLRGDCHCHSDWSDGGSPIGEMAQAALELGLEYMVLTDHSPRLRVARGLSPERLRRQLEEVARLNAELHPFRILTGIEVDILDDGALDQEAELLGELDLVVASVHSKLRMEGGQMTERMVTAVSNPHTDILGHCTGRLVEGRLRPQSSFSPQEVFSACAAHGTAVEINSRPERRDPPPPLLRQAAASGCLFAIDSDAHAPGQLEWLGFGCEQAVEASVPVERIVNSWELPQLLSWARTGPGA
ncbi:MAG: PHP domain-containing protein, partial [Candidatus Dormibacteria bacterium]